MSASNRGQGSSALTERVDRAQSGEQSASRDDAPRDNKAGAISPPIEQTTGPIEAVEDQPQAQTEQANPYGARDIVAQETMADASVWMAVAAFMTFIVTGVGTWLIRTQVKLTREAVLDTSEATEAMRDANEIARETSKRQLRAYVGTEDHAMFGFVIGQRQGHICKIYNRGQTPAYDVEIWSRPTVVNTHEASPHQARIFKGGEIEQSKAVLGPGQFIVHQNRADGPLVFASYWGVSVGGLAIVWGGIISYRDAFGKRHKTTFKYFASGEGEELPDHFDMLACNNGNVAT